jgi:hypothetical protein
VPRIREIYPDLSLEPQNSLEQIYCLCSSAIVLMMLSLVLLCAGPMAQAMAMGSWVAGGDEGVSWKVTASSQYDGCSGYDLCNYQYACDGTTSTVNGTVGKVFALGGPSEVAYPQWVQIDFGGPLPISRWRVWSGAGRKGQRVLSSGLSQYSGKDMHLEIEGKNVSGSQIANADVSGGGGSAFVSDPFAAVAVQVIRVMIPDEWPNSAPGNGFQLYMNEIQFFTGPGSTYACVSGKCLPHKGGISKQDCTTMCGAPLYQCIDRACVVADTGVSQAECKAACL